MPFSPSVIWLRFIFLRDRTVLVEALAGQRIRPGFCLNKKTDSIWNRSWVCFKLEDCSLSFFVKQMNLINIHRHFDLLSSLRSNAGGNSGGQRVASTIKVQMRLSAHHFGNIDFALEQTSSSSTQENFLCMQIFRSYAQRNLFADIVCNTRHFVENQ